MTKPASSTKTAQQPAATSKDTKDSGRVRMGAGLMRFTKDTGRVRFGAGLMRF